jgi:hypothetical protein
MANRQQLRRPQPVTLIQAFAAALRCDCTAGRASFFARPAPPVPPRDLSPKMRSDRERDRRLGREKSAERGRQQAAVDRLVSRSRGDAAVGIASANRARELARATRVRAKAEAAEGRTAMAEAKRRRAMAEHAQGDGSQSPLLVAA